jgi:hypothetical protein
VPSLADWEKEWEKNSQRNAQPKLVPVDFWLNHPRISEKSTNLYFAEI